jgi:hypothetical protein
MSGLMAQFFANMLPYIALLWALELLLFYRRELFNVTEFYKIIPPLAAVVFICFLILLPIRTCINKCYGD